MNWIVFSFVYLCHLLLLVVEMDKVAMLALAYESTENGLACFTRVYRCMHLTSWEEHWGILQQTITVKSQGVPPYMGFIGMHVPKGYCYLAVLVIYRTSILATLVLTGVCFLHSSLEYSVCFLEETTFSSLPI